MLLLITEAEMLTKLAQSDVVSVAAGMVQHAVWCAVTERKTEQSGRLFRVPKNKPPDLRSRGFPLHVPGTGIEPVRPSLAKGF